MRSIGTDVHQSFAQIVVWLFERTVVVTGPTGRAATER